MSLVGRFVFQCLTALQSNKIVYDGLVFVQKVHNSRVSFHNELLIQKSCFVLFYFWLFRWRSCLLSWKFTDGQWFHTHDVLGNLSADVKRLFIPFEWKIWIINWIQLQDIKSKLILYNARFFLSTKCSPKHRIYRSDSCSPDHLL